MKLKAALIVDNLSLTEWQIEALEYASDQLEIRLVLNCTNTVTKRDYIRNFAYYVLHFFTLNLATRRRPSNIPGAETVSFESSYDRDGMWQSIPPDVVQKVKSENIKIIVKFGMSLLRIDDQTSEFDILSFHHGDPEHYRGRPAGFYELYKNERRIGVVVQKLSNKLDAGVILARGYSKIFHHSYKRTAESFYSISHYLLRMALVNYLQNAPIELQQLGRNYRLPNNSAVIRFILKLLRRRVFRLIYGAFYEKRWNLVKYDLDPLKTDTRLSVSAGKVANVSSDYLFYADPFFAKLGDRICCEALNPRSGMGEVVELNANDLSFVRSIRKGSNHYSYPFTFEDMDKGYILPEVASHSAPYLLSEPFENSARVLLDGLGNVRILDGTLIKNDNIYYLFGGQKASAYHCLFLYFSHDLTGPYETHPQNPIVIDPTSARMGGRILHCGGRLYRFGQNNCYNYGDGLTITEITILSKEQYAETYVGSISFNDAHGPHTIDVFGKSTILDFYVDRFSLFAGPRRIAAKYWE